MKVIDLLNKIANGEEVPKKIKYEGIEYTHIDNYCYVDKDSRLLSYEIYAEQHRLNDEVEIIEDTPKENKKIAKIDISKFPKRNNSLKKTALKVNEIIKLLNNSVLLSEKEVDKFLDKVNGE